MPMYQVNLVMAKVKKKFQQTDPMADFHQVVTVPRINKLKVREEEEITKNHSILNHSHLLV